jgi:hypothetical protein
MQTVRPARSDDILDHRSAPYSCALMGLADAISLRSRRRKFALFMETMAPTESTTVLDIGVDDVAFGEDSGCRALNFFRGAATVRRCGARRASAGSVRATRARYVRGGTRPSIRGRPVRHRVLVAVIEHVSGLKRRFVDGRCVSLAARS